MSVNRCDRCDRELMDPIAQYGWRCDKLMRSEPMPMPLMEAFPDLYLKVLEAADAFLSRHEIHSSRVDLAKFYEATAEYLLLKEMPPNPFIEESRRRALQKVYDAFGLEQDEVDPSVFTSRSVSSMFATLLEFWLENEAGTYTPPPEPVLPIPEYMKNVRNPSNASLDTLLDGFQFGLDAVGLLPGLGEIADGVNGGISLLRGDYVDATLSFASMIPFAGWASTAGKWGKKALKYSDEVLAAVKHADEAGGLLGRSGGNIRINSLDDFISNPKILKEATPDEWYRYFNDKGFDPKPLGSKSSLKGIPFDKGGGYRIHWGGDRYLQYHPSASSHHGGAYWKVSSGATGALRFDLNGNLLS